MERLALARTGDFFFLNEQRLVFFNGLRRAVQKVGDGFGTDSSGDPFERMTIVFFFDRIARAIRRDDIIFSHLV